MGWTRDGSEGDWIEGISGSRSLSLGSPIEPYSLHHGCQI